MGLIGALGTGLGSTIGGLASGLSDIGTAKLQSGAASRSAQITADAAMRRAELDRQSAEDQLEYVRGQSELDRLSQRHADRQNYGLSRAEGMNAFSRFGDTSYNVRASELSRGRTEDKRYGANQLGYNTMRDLMGMPNKPLSVYVEPDALRLTAPVLPDYVEDPTPVRQEDIPGRTTRNRTNV
jgi:hypothetical protein